MFRFLLTVSITAAATLAYIVFNPGGSCRNLLEAAGLLEQLKETYGIDVPAEPDPAPAPVPQSPAPAPPLTATPTTPAPVAAPPPPPPQQAHTDFVARAIKNLEEENRRLEQKRAEYAQARGGSSIPSGDARAIQREIDANNARILELKSQQNRPGN